MDVWLQLIKIVFVYFFHLDEKTKLQEEKNPHEQQINFFGKVRKSLKHLYLSVFVHSRTTAETSWCESTLDVSISQ